MIAEDIQRSVPKLYPSEAGSQQPNQTNALVILTHIETAIQLDFSGYIQTIDLESLFRIAKNQNVVIHLNAKPGDHILSGARVATVNGPLQIETGTIANIQQAFDLDRERTPEQDIRYQFQQLTDIVIRALSPGINDPFTATNGIDELAAAIQLFARREW